jgi:hypothetical protein
MESNFLAPMIVRKAFLPKISRFCSVPLGIWCLLIVFNATATDRFVDANSTNPTAPFTDWNTAATNIQDAIDVSGDGDQVWVTNGIYATGGKVITGDLTNRVALDKAIAVRSVRGPALTIIQGAGATNGPLAVRCAWLTNGAVLSGFTLQAGATRTSGTDLTVFTYGGGAWCASSNSVVANCVVQSNTAGFDGGGVYRGALTGCLLIGNKAQFGGGAYGSVLNNCTVISNSTGTASSTLTNCIVYFNGGGNYSGGTWSFCCSAPVPPGQGNINADPQLFVDNLHLANSSPCRGTGTNTFGGTDIFGMPWANPPSMGCAEWEPSLIVGKPTIRFNSDPVGFALTAAVAGAQPFSHWWLRDGTELQNGGPYESAQPTNGVSVALSLFDPGNYQVVVSNAFGTVTSPPVQLVVHYVDAAGMNPVGPYVGWSTAATNVQDAVDAASAGDVVLVTNGIYGFGGKSIDGTITNRLSIDKPLLVASVNGPIVTTVQGATDPSSTNGPGAVRCVWLTNNATLSGFTLRGGATRSVTPSPNQSMEGGGILGTSTNAVVSDCWLIANSSSYLGGGAFLATLNRCTLMNNSAVGSGSAGGGIAGAGSGGGAANCTLKNCLLTSNSAIQSNGGGTENCRAINCAFTNNRAGLNGGGADQGTLLNCTIIGNISGGYGAYGGAAANCTLTNCIVYGNISAGVGPTNYNLCTFAYCDSDPLPPGPGNIDTDPEVISDAVHLAPTSPCVGAGLAGVASGTDIDGQPWANPPSIGCDEWLPAPVVVGPTKASLMGPPPQLRISVNPPAGLGPFSFAWLKDGALLAGDSHFNLDTPTNLVVYEFGPADAGAYQFIVSNSYGAVTSAVVQAVVHCVHAASAQPIPPYYTWSSAAANIQDAIDIAQPGEFILVTNGVYASGGAVVSGDLTNRVALNKPVTVMSLNGYSSTVIRGGWDPTTTNGPLAVRCAWVSDGASLSGFTLQQGATRAAGATALQSGGGVWASSTNASISDCVVATNAANANGGGCYQGRLYRCMLLGNVSAQTGAGAYGSFLGDCLLRGNSAAQYGGGTYNGNLINCTVVGNHAGITGGGLYIGAIGGTGVSARNCILQNNSSLRGVDNWAGLSSSIFSYSCTTPAVPGTGNLNIDPELLDGIHLAVNSPCRGAGDPVSVVGTDLTGASWANPPSMGCYEVSEAAATGPMSVSLVPLLPSAVVGKSFPLSATVNGWASRAGWDFGDGSILTNASLLTVSHSWTNPGDYAITFTAFNADHPNGVATNLMVVVEPLAAPALSAEGLAGTGFTLSFRGQPGVSYVVESALDLSPPIGWQPVATLFSFGGLMRVTDPQATNVIQFYRVRAQ